MLMKMMVMMVMIMMMIYQGRDNSMNKDREVLLISCISHLIPYDAFDPEDNILETVNSFIGKIIVHDNAIIKRQTLHHSLIHSLR